MFNQAPAPSRNDIFRGILNNIRNEPNIYMKINALEEFIGLEQDYLRSLPNPILRSPLLDSAKQLLRTTKQRYGLENPIEIVGLQIN